MRELGDNAPVRPPKGARTILFSTSGGQEYVYKQGVLACKIIADAHSTCWGLSRIIKVDTARLCFVCSMITECYVSFHADFLSRKMIENAIFMLRRFHDPLYMPQLSIGMDDASILQSRFGGASLIVIMTIAMARTT